MNSYRLSLCGSQQAADRTSEPFMAFGIHCHILYFIIFVKTSKSITEKWIWWIFHVPFTIMVKKIKATVSFHSHFLDRKCKNLHRDYEDWGIKSFIKGDHFSEIFTSNYQSCNEVILKKFFLSIVNQFCYISIQILLKPNLTKKFRIK